ncbi:MAG: hypothetical protein OXE55_01520 [Flavobacteriaceae bacterium]|nr:hypothetical protein [Flavobacteriaceae bacterium]
MSCLWDTKKKEKQVNLLTAEELNQRLKTMNDFNPKSSEEKKEEH